MLNNKTYNSGKISVGKGNFNYFLLIKKKCKFINEKIKIKQKIIFKD